MKLNPFRFYSEFRKDLNLTVATEMQRFGKPSQLRTLILGCVFFIAYIYSKPFFIYYKGKCERKFRIEELKRNGEYIF